MFLPNQEDNTPFAAKLDDSLTKPTTCRLPLYYEAKLLLVLWLILPQFKVNTYKLHRLSDPSLLGKQVSSRKPFPAVR